MEDSPARAASANSKAASSTGNKAASERRKKLAGSQQKRSREDVGRFEQHFGAQRKADRSFKENTPTVKGGSGSDCRSPARASASPGARARRSATPVKSRSSPSSSPSVKPTSPRVKLEKISTENVCVNGKKAAARNSSGNERQSSEES